MQWLIQIVMGWIYRYWDWLLEKKYRPFAICFGPFLVLFLYILYKAPIDNKIPAEILDPILLVVILIYSTFGFVALLVIRKIMKDYVDYLQKYGRQK